ncbi:MAG: peptidoglycan DD-metalloendopeptidase family protein [Candidatus Buchananbacteria bacterium]
MAIILPLYKFIILTKKVFNKFYAPHKRRHRIIHPFSRRYFGHIILIIISFLTIAANLNANEIQRDEFDKTSILASLVTNEDLGSIAEEGPVISNKKVTSYLGLTGIANKPQVSEEELSEISAPTTAVGDSAIVRQIISPDQEQQASQRNEAFIYIIQQGDTISSIAKKFGISNNTILWENNLNAYSIIQPGDKLTILPVSGIKHKVAKNDTLAKIAKLYGVEAEDILSFNKITSADDIRIGESLMIPGGKKIIAETPTYSLRKITQQPTTSQVVSSGKMAWPTNCRRISQYFGWRHTGLDIACGLGNPIYAANSGRITKAQGGWNGGYGNMIIVDHGKGVQTVYGHLSKIYVTVGETVDKGQLIGAMGSTGRSTGPHLHLEVRIGGVRKNPLSYIR